MALLPWRPLVVTFSRGDIAAAIRNRPRDAGCLVPAGRMHPLSLTINTCKHVGRQ